jgi:hypothetical protein
MSANRAASAVWSLACIAMLMALPNCKQTEFSGQPARQSANAAHDNTAPNTSGPVGGPNGIKPGQDDGGDGKDGGGKDGDDGKDGGHDKGDGDDDSGGGKNDGKSDGDGDSDSGGSDVGGDDGASGGSDVDVEDSTVAKKVALSDSLNLDGHSVICLDVKSGHVTLRKLHDRYFAARVRFAVTRGNDSVDEVVLASASGDADGDIPGWKTRCGPDPTRNPGWAPGPTDGHRDQGPAIKVYVEGNRSCIDVDDAEDGRGGAVQIKGFDFGAKPC